MTTVLRAAAVAIALAGAIDPACTVSRRARPPVAVAIADGPMRDRADSNGTARRAMADAVRTRIAADLRREFTMQTQIASDTVAAVLIGDRYGHVDRNIPIATVTVGEPIGPDVAIVRVEAPSAVLPGTAVRMQADIDGTRARGQTSTLSVTSEGLPLATATHTWTSDAERWRPSLEVPPVGEPPFTYRIEAMPLAGEQRTIDNAADVSVERRGEPLRILAYDARPSWAATFVRRALESDPRFSVDSLTASSRAIATRTAGAVRLTDAALSGFDAVIVAGVERLTAPDIRALDDFMRQRGGAVVVLPDRRIDEAAVVAWLNVGPLRERLSEQPDTLATPSPLPALRASELLVPGALPPAAEPLAGTSGRDAAAAVAVMPRGDGRLIYSGALDAWRFRAADDAAFDRYWQSVVAGAAAASPRPIELEVDRSIVRPGDRVTATVRVRGGGSSAVRAASDGRPFRLWPDSEAGLYRGSFVAHRAGDVRVVVQDSASPAHAASHRLVVRDDVVAPTRDVGLPLALVSASHHGIDVRASAIADAEAFVRRRVPAQSSQATVRPMRSPWWIVPFAACLSAEWYLRRRRGQR